MQSGPMLELGEVVVCGVLDVYDGDVPDGDNVDDEANDDDDGGGPQSDEQLLAAL